MNKKETLEEVAENKFGKVNPTLGKSDYRIGYESGLIGGAKWQQERSYTLEQISQDFVGEGKVGGYFDDYLDYRISTDRYITFKEWFEQFKKK